MRNLAAAFLALAMALAIATAPAHAAFENYTQAAFSEALSGTAPVLVHVHADWCPVCKRQIPILDALIKEPEFRGMKAIRINFDVDREIVERLSIRSQSTVIIIKNGAITSASSYETDAAQLRAQLRSGL